MKNGECTSSSTNSTLQYGGKPAVSGYRLGIPFFTPSSGMPESIAGGKNIYPICPLC